MFGDIKVPFNSVMLYNVAKLKEGITIWDVEEHLGTMCNIVKNKYKGFLAGQVFEYAGFVSKEGSVGDLGPEGNHIAIITYCYSLAYKFASLYLSTFWWSRELILQWC